MRVNDEQLGKPEIVYKGTKAAIEAAFATEGMHAWATDTHEQGYYSGSAWVWGGGAGASTFTDLTDTPADYTADGGKFVRVNAGETALEFAAIAGGGDVVGPASAVDGHLAVFDTTTGKLIKDGGAVPVGGGDVLEVQVFS